MPDSQSTPHESAAETPHHPITRETVRAYKRAAARLRQVLDGPAEGLAISFELSAARGQPTSGSFKAGDRVHRHAALLRPFMARGSEIELRNVWEQVTQSGVDESVRVGMEQTFANADRLSMAIQLDGRALTAREVYDSFGEGQYFGTDPQSRGRLDGLNVGPFSALLEMLFHEACAAYTGVVFRLLDVLLDQERSQPRAATAQSTGPCIYCRTRAGDFGPEEHVIPESLGGDELVLVGAVCAGCNNRLSRLDQVVLDFEPIAFLRAVYGPLTKKGKFPQARFRDFDVERTAPRALKVTGKSGKGLPEPMRQPDGTVRFSMSALGRRRFDPIPLARGLFKIGLGLVAYHAGVEVALSNRYDAARRFILDGQPMDTHLVMTRVGKPHPELRTWVQPGDGGTGVVIDVFGVVFGFTLEAAPQPPEELPAELVTTFWLGAGDGPSDPGTTDSSG